MIVEINDNLIKEYKKVCHIKKYTKENLKAECEEMIKDFIDCYEG